VTLATDLPPSRRLHRYRRSEYERMGELGIFGQSRVELLYGMVVTMSPQGSVHAHAVRRLNMILAPALQGRAEVQVQLPLALSDDSEPEPDVSVVAPGDYLDELPRTASLVVEAANDSLQHDRTVKGRLYAEAGIPEYWLVDLERKRVERYLAPSAGVYTQLTTHGPDETLSPLAFPDVRVPLAEILPR
jgi:Uma2 family endonuclease